MNKIKVNKKIYYSYLICLYLFILTLNLFVFPTPSAIILGFSTLFIAIIALFLESIKIDITEEKIIYRLPLFKKEAKIKEINEIKKEQYVEVIRDQFGKGKHTQQAKYMFLYNKKGDELLRISYLIIDRKMEKKIVDAIKEKKPDVYLDPYYENIKEEKRIDKKIIIAYFLLIIWLITIPILF